MFRRRRRRSSFSRRGGGAPPQMRFIMIGAGAAVFLALFLFFMRQADVLAPEPSEIRVELPDAFKE